MTINNMKDINQTSQRTGTEFMVVGIVLVVLAILSLIR